MRTTQVTSVASGALVISVERLGEAHSRQASESAHAPSNLIAFIAFIVLPIPRMLITLLRL